MKLNYKIIGTGHPLIILHGLFGMLDNWRSIARMLEHKYQCILVDQRNHGRSPRDDEMNYKVMSQDVFELMENLHIEHAYLLGHSMGGKVAMQFALTWPERVDKLIVVDISPRKYPVIHKSEIKAIQAIVPAQIKDRKEAEKILARFLGDDQATIQFLMKNLTRLPEGGFEWKANMPLLISNYDQLMQPIESPAPFDKPVLFIRGGRSKSIKEEDWESILILFPRAQLTTLPAGHWVHADQPEIFEKTVSSFLHS